VEQLPGVRRFVMEHLHNGDNVLADVERAGATISGEKSDLVLERGKNSRVCLWGSRKMAPSVKGRQSVELALVRELY